MWHEHVVCIPHSWFLKYTIQVDTNSGSWEFQHAIESLISLGQSCYFLNAIRWLKSKKNIDRYHDEN